MSFDISKYSKRISKAARSLIKKTPFPASMSEPESFDLYHFLEVVDKQVLQQESLAEINSKENSALLRDFELEQGVRPIAKNDQVALYQRLLRNLKQYETGSVLNQDTLCRHSISDDAKVSTVSGKDLNS